ncbi:MAG: RDD family protein [Gammaproteobacteria bacterium]|nr:RDD family protein [Gammaproteobacteria bacterium]|tara:strand:- start:652 stop:1062 length:411 start_codon:yes stop_codon:yes gene_type:complete
MKDKSYIVFPLKRIAATIYDLFLLLGVWFGVGSLALWINGGEILNPWIGLAIVFISTWCFYSYFWIHGGKTLGMAVWKFEIYSLNGNKVNLYQTSIRFGLNLITFFMAGLPLFMIYFSSERLSLSDRISKTSYKKI